MLHYIKRNDAQSRAITEAWYYNERFLLPQAQSDI
jgi:hypothetical protein